MKNVICSIVARNYLPLAFNLGDSVKKNNPESDFFILIADEVGDLNQSDLPYQTHTLDILNIDNIEELQFKYNVTEFCTSVKPYYLNYLLAQGYDKAIYFDPDIYAFSPLDEIFNELDSKSIVVTPHFITPELNYTGTITESLLLHVGVFNLGFVGVKNSKDGISFLNWWEKRLYDKCYGDKIEALHTDQKWIDLAPALFTNSIKISEDIGRNVAFWNLHEREVIMEDDGNHKVKNRFTNQTTNLMFFHFAGFDINKCDTLIHKNHPEYTMVDFPELKALLGFYKNALLKNNFYKFINYKYAYNEFSNGKPISVFQRRMYRRLVEDGVNLKKPFNCSENYYKLLEANHLLTSDKNPDKLNERNFDGFDSKMRKLNSLMRLLKLIIGFERYSLLLKFFQRYSKPENQIFLINKYKENFELYNENRRKR